MADEGIKAGDAFIDVTLRMRPDAWARLTADNSRSASKSGDDLGDRIGQAIAKKIAASVKDGLTQGGIGVGAQGAKQGEDFGGKFAEDGCPYSDPDGRGQDKLERAIRLARTYRFPRGKGE